MELSGFENPVGLIIPGYSFYVTMELSAGIDEVFSPLGISWISISGGYIAAKPEDAAKSSDHRTHDAQGNWIYDLIPRIDLSGAIVYGGGLIYDVSDLYLRNIIDSLPGIPVVNVGTANAPVPCVNADNYNGMFQLVDEVLQSLQDRTEAQRTTVSDGLVFIAGPKGNFEADERLRAFGDACAARGVGIDDTRILPGDFTSDTARELTRAVLDDRKRPPRAIICCNDLSAFGASEILKDRGIRIPKDCILTGFDDFEYAAAMHPSLSTVHFPIREMGREAARLIIRQSEESSAPRATKIISIPAFTVLRESTGHRLQKRQIARAREMLLFDMRSKEKAPYRSMFTKALLESPRLKSIMPALMEILPECGVYSLGVFLYTDVPTMPDKKMLRLDDGFIRKPSGEIIRLEPDSQLFEEGRVLCPQDHFNAIRSSGPRLHLCPLQHEQLRLGYILTTSSEVALDFPENIADQLSGYLHRWRLFRSSQRQQEEMQRMIARLQEMQIALDNVEQLQQMGRLVAGVGHELNTPIGSSLTLASFLADRAREVEDRLEDSVSGGEVAKFISQSREAADSLMRNLNRSSKLIRTFRSLSVDPAENNVRRFFLYQVLDVCVQRFLDLPDFRLTLRSDCPENIELTNDPEAIEFCIEQLLENSLHHSYSGETRGTVDIHVVKEAQRVILRYRDYGHLHPELDMERIFEPFYTTMRAKGRTGLGLHIVQNMVRYRMKGGISVDLPKQGGMEFLLSIPSDLSEHG